LSGEVKDAPAPEGVPAEGSREGRSIVRAASIVSAATMVSRLLGVVREQVFATLLGASLQADAFQIAFRIPNLLRDLFAEGALSAAFVPTYARVRLEQGPDAAHRLASRLLTLLAAALGLVVVAGLVFAEPLVDLLAPGFDAIPGKSELATRLTRVMLPFLPLVSFAALAMGMLNAEERFGTPALAPATFNVVSILWGLLLWVAGFETDRVVLGWAVGTLLGGAAQFLIQVPPLWRAGWRYRPEWAPGDPAIRRIGSLMAPATVGLAAVQVNIFVNSIFASHEPGAVSWLSYAFRILYLPIGIFGVAVGTIATAGLARRAAANDLGGMSSTLRESLRLLAFLTMPATAGLMLLGVPVTRLLYERGAFSAADTQSTATAVFYYAIGLVAYTGVKVLAPAFYALGRPRVPLLASALAVTTNLVMNAALFGTLGFRAVALGTSLASLANAAVLIVVFERSVGGLGAQGTGSSLARMAAASAMMGAVVWSVARALEQWVGTAGIGRQAVTALGPVLAGVAAYLVLAHLLRIPEARTLFSVLRRRASRNR
jgi:putative peptidoglycan lipid II flippase